jgi:hypothetical protein
MKEPDMDTRVAFSTGRARFAAVFIFLALAGGDVLGAQQGFELSSPDFFSGGRIARENTGEGVDISPELSWSGEPPGTESFALIAEDPDAPSGSWVHWVIYNIPKDKTGLREGLPRREVFSDGSTQGVNSWGETGYAGPMPPPGPDHRYFFKLYALDTTLSLKPGASAAELERAMKGRILAQTELMGRFGR